ncbi:MAG: 1-acyl-sn-glycerol-3-phosphate acyltransferase [Firmicutes bacterium]|nr:1-acyl-sn-glycerol-3-phosphate acyltransferase [Bacillota bacterium]
MLRTFLVGIFLLLYLLCVAPWFLIYAAITAHIEPLYRVGVFGARLALRLAGVQIHVEGREHVPAQPCVFLANHASNADPPAVVAAIPKRVALMAKKELFRIPIFGRALLTGGFVPVDRSDPEAARRSVEHAIARVREGLSFLVFPEGTRSRDGRLQPFKKGAFVIAIAAGVPVVPISVAGSQCVMPKGAVAIRPGTIRVRFHPAIPTTGMTLDDRNQLSREVHRVIASGLPKEQQPPS